MQELTKKVKQKMRLGEIKRAAKNTRDIDNYLIQLEGRLETMMNQLKQRSEDLDVAMKYRFDALRRDLEAEWKDQATRTPIYIDGGRFVMFSSPFGNIVIPSEEAGLISFLLLHRPEEIETGTRIVMREILKPGDVAVDIGANIGLHMITMGQCVGKDGQVFAFEPTPNLVKALKHTAILTGMRQAKIVPQLVMDRNGPHKLYSFGHSPENSIYAVFDADASHVTTVDVKACTLDHFFPAGTRVDFVKVDVEGAEPLVWKGMQRLIHENKQLKMILEMSPEHFARSGTSLEAFYDDLTGAGFKVQAIDEETGYTEAVSVESIRTFTTLNVLLTREL